MAKIPGRCIYALGDGVNALTTAVPGQCVLREEGDTLSKAAHEPHAPEEGAMPRRHHRDNINRGRGGGVKSAHHIGANVTGWGREHEGGHSGNSAGTTSWWEWLGGALRCDQILT